MPRNLLQLARDFSRSTSGNMAMYLGMTMIPLGLAMGLAIDYSGASTTRSDMQNALDTAVLAAVGVDSDHVAAELQSVYEGNGGAGVTKVENVAMVDGVRTITASATYKRPTTLMRIGHIESTDVAVVASATRQSKLIEVTFRTQMVKGWYSKKVTLYGRRAGEPDFIPLSDIDYVFNGIERSYGVGTTTMYVYDEYGVRSEKAKQVCNGAELSSCSPRNAADAGVATVDVSDMDSLYLKMTTSGGSAWRKLVNAGFPSVISTMDPKTSHYLMVDRVQMPRNTPINIYEVVPCGKTSSQAWEDGGTFFEGKTNKLTFADTDFQYTIDGKCGVVPGSQGATLTQ